jgi:triphosphoribosyl-dephospho-CoA synthetase
VLELENRTADGRKSLELFDKSLRTSETNNPGTTADLMRGVMLATLNGYRP